MNNKENIISTISKLNGTEYVSDEEVFIVLDMIADMLVNNDIDLEFCASLLQMLHGCKESLGAERNFLRGSICGTIKMIQIYCNKLNSREVNT